MGVPPLGTGSNIGGRLADIGVGALSERRIPPGSPGDELCRLLSGFDLAQGSGQCEEFFAGFGARVAGKMGANAGMNMKSNTVG